MMPSVLLHCPYCGEAIELVIEGSNEQHDYIEDCQVCCRPIAVTAWMDDGVAQVRVRTENE